MRKQKKLICVLAVSALAVLGAQLATAIAGGGSNKELPLGKEISVVAANFLAENSEIAKNYIFEAKVARADTKEERLALIQAKQEELTSSIQAVRDERRELIQAHNRGVVDNETFVAEIKKLAGKMKAHNGTIGSIGRKIAEVNKEMADQLSAQAKARVEAHGSLMAEFRSEHKATIEELEKMGYGRREEYGIGNGSVDEDRDHGRAEGQERRQQ